MKGYKHSYIEPKERKSLMQIARPLPLELVHVLLLLAALIGTLA
jgi:hypothetical protein